MITLREALINKSTIENIKRKSNTAFVAFCHTHDEEDDKKLKHYYEKIPIYDDNHELVFNAFVYDMTRLKMDIKSLKPFAVIGVSKYNIKETIKELKNFKCNYHLGAELQKTQWITPYDIDQFIQIYNFSK